MFFINIFKRENRRSDKDLKKSNTNSGAPKKGTPEERRTDTDRRNDIGRRKGLYYSLPENQKDTVEAIINMLENRLKK
jgi:hypothetical protein